MGPLRVVLGLAGLFVIVYWIGGTIGNAVAGQFYWQTSLFPAAGVLIGSLLIGFAIWGGRPAVRSILLRALATGAAVALLGAVPGLVVLGMFLGGVAPHLITAVVLIPGLFVAGAIFGGTVGYMRQRRPAPPPTAQ